jgi:hypothetical protein
VREFEREMEIERQRRENIRKWIISIYIGSTHAT